MNACKHCGYDLTGLDDATLCPECGRNPEKSPRLHPSTWVALRLFGLLVAFDLAHVVWTYTVPVSRWHSRVIYGAAADAVLSVHLLVIGVLVLLLAAALLLGSGTPARRDHETKFYLILAGLALMMMKLLYTGVINF